MEKDTKETDKGKNTRSFVQSPLKERLNRNYKLNNSYIIENFNKREPFTLSPAISPKQSPTLSPKNIPNIDQLVVKI